MIITIKVDSKLKTVSIETDDENKITVVPNSVTSASADSLIVDEDSLNYITGKEQTVSFYMREAAKVSNNATLGVKEVSNLFHVNMNDLVSLLTEQNILFRNYKNRLQATEDGIEKGWAVSIPFTASNGYTDISAKLTKKGIEHIAMLLSK